MSGLEKVKHGLSVMKQVEDACELCFGRYRFTLFGSTRNIVKRRRLISKAQGLILHDRIITSDKRGLK